ncbi:hypothetical protein B5M09_011461 [Aphanomyces astaci]|uniref:Uncharacterized protein n=1 Tax=Aphanomyces astaci TaxID=112090 RepID=A0A3R7Y4D6_APHAT|nr:hypothetical protein B5M09_011461 [Aphanomyces astaci]
MATQTPPEQDADHDRILFPREWVSPEQEVQEAGIIRIEDLFGRAPTTIDALYSLGTTWITSLQAEQPTPGNPGAASGELCQPDFGEEDTVSSDMTVTETALAPPAPDMESPPADDDLMGTGESESEPAPPESSGEYEDIDMGTSATLPLASDCPSTRALGLPPGRTACDNDTHLEADAVVSGITDLKHSIRDVMQTNPAFLGQYNPRWMQRLTDTSKASQETVEAFIDKFFSRLLAAHPAQGVDKLDWCGYPEIAAASAVWQQPVYVLQEQETEHTWWLWRVGFMPGQEDIEKTPIPVGNWTTIFITLTSSDVLLVHKRGTHFDSIHLTPPPRTSAALTPGRRIKAPPKLPVRYTRRLTKWLKDNTDSVPAGLLTTPINEAAQLEPLLEQFPLTARSMIWEVGTPEVLLSRCSPPILVTWGKQLLAAMARVTLTQIASLHKKPELTGLLDTWKEDIVRAASVDAAVQLATNQPRWGELLARAETPPSVIVLRALTAITAIQ